MENTVEIRHVTHAYRTPHDPLPVLNDLSLAIPTGAFCAVVGPSGCGKSTLTRLIAGLMKPDQGQVFLHGEPVRGPRNTVGMAFQNPVLLEWRSILDNVILPLEIVAPHMPRRDREARARELLALVGLEGFESKRPSELSGGMRQRASLCRAIVHKPEVLILDEPFGALDAFTREDLWQTMHALRREEPFTTLLITHDLRESIFLADDVVVLSGRPATAQYRMQVPGGTGRVLDDLYTPGSARRLNVLRHQIQIAQGRATSKYVADAELDRARMGNLRDLFQGIASVSVGGAIPVAQKIFVNGVDMLNLAVTVDGVSQNNRIFHHVLANAFDPGLMKFVRVDAGIAAADAGPNALAGAVVMETVGASDILRDGAAIGGNARLSYADNGRTFSRSLTLAGQHQGLEWLGYLKSATGDDYKVGGGAVLAGTAADLHSSLGKLAYESDQGHRVELSGQRMRDDMLRRSRANIGDVIGGRPYTPLRRYDTTRDTVALTYRNTQAEGIRDPTLSIGRSRVTIGVDQPDFAGIDRSLGRSQNRNGKIENRFHLSDRDTVTVGIDRYSRSSTYSDEATPGLTETARNTGIYAQARLEPTQTIATSFGLRQDWQDFTGVDGTALDVSGASGNAAVAWQATETLRLRAGVSTVFGGIVLEDNFIFDTFSTYEGLRAARSRNATLGFDHDAGALRVDGELFATDVDDARNVVRGVAQNFDFDSRGFNLGATHDWQQGFLRASYSKSRVRVNGATASSFAAQDYGTPLGGVLALEVQHNPAGSAFTFGGSVQAAQRYTHTGAEGELPLPGYGVVDLFVEYVPPPQPDVTIRAEVANLLDKRYSDRATYGADFDSISPLFEPGRTVSLTASMRF